MQQSYVSQETGKLRLKYASKGLSLVALAFHYFSLPDGSSGRE
jgi:hypothetical protein